MSVENDVVVGHRRGAGWVRVAHGVHRRMGQADDLQAWRLVLPPSGRFTHLTAAARHGLWLPPLPRPLPLWAAQLRSETRPQRPGLVVSRHPSLAPAEQRGGVPLDSVAATVLACARDLAVLDLVVLLDAALQLRRCSVEELRDVAAARRRGAPRLREALDLADGRSESPFESLLRVLHVTAEVPVEPQRAVLDDTGQLVARGDLWLRGTTVLHEYDGAHHLDRRRQRKDLARVRRIDNHGWTRRGYTREDVLGQATAILRDADLALGREHRPGRIRPWHRMLADSLFSRSGQARLLTRLGAAAPSRTRAGHGGSVGS